MRIGIACPYSWDVPGGVQFHIRHMHRLCRRPGCSAGSAAENCPQPRYQFAWVEWFGKIIVRSKFKTKNAVQFTASCCEHQHGDRTFLPQLLKHIQSAHAG